jgi:beta-galactosidase
VLIVQSNGKKGDIIVKAKADNGIENKLVLKAQ